MAAAGWAALAAGSLGAAAGAALLLAAATGGLEEPPLLAGGLAAVLLGGGVAAGVLGWRAAQRSRQAALHPRQLRAQHRELRREVLHQEEAGPSEGEDGLEGLQAAEVLGEVLGLKKKHRRILFPATEVTEITERINSKESCALPFPQIVPFSLLSVPSVAKR